MARTLVIAEMGSCHDGDWLKARRFVDVAKDAGADVLKAQWVSNVDELVRRRRAEKYRQAYDVINFPYWWHAHLEKHCREAGLEYMCTVYLPEDITLIAPFVKRFKVASFEATDLEFILTHFEHANGRDVIVSTGMMSDDDVFDLDISTLAFGQVKLLHCVSAYPAPLEAMNLRNILEGLSDHTTHPLTGAVAVGAGAKIIEAHVRLEDTFPWNPDYAHSRTPGQFKEYVANIRTAEKMMGRPVKQMQDCEREMAQYRVRPPEET